jgi:hypothetical protein
MNTPTASGLTSIPPITINNASQKLSWRKYTPGETGALPGEVNATYILLASQSTIKDVLGFTSDFTFGHANVEMPNIWDLRPIDYFYLTSPNVQSSSFAPQLGGNAILARIRILSSRGQVQSLDNENMGENLLNCSYIPMQWTFKLVDKYGKDVGLLSPFSFTLRIIPE